jgi:two-component system, OmpR family, phosphate regulon sensor histidine kinase PhoR
MSWLIPRFGLVLVAALVGALAGAQTAAATAEQSALGAALAAAAAAGAILIVDGIRLSRFSRWLRRGGPSGTARAPGASGLWGDLAYRVQRGFHQRDLATEQARAQLAQLMNAIEASPNGVLLLDPQDQIEWCSAVAADHLGLDPVRDVGQPVTNLVRMPPFVVHMQLRSFGDAVKFTPPSGRGTLSVVVRPYGEGQKLVLTQDITERERADAMRRDFVANVSHEIRTPLTVLAGFVETMGNLPLTEPERKRVLFLMEQQTQRMQSLVADLLTLAKIEGSPRPSTDHWVSVSRLMAQVEAEAQPLSAGRHQIQVDRGPPTLVAGNESELVSALGNLVGNAVRYTPAGGQIHMAWRLRDDGGGALEVRDTGIGIAEEHLARVTERFYRVDSSRSRDTGGTGLGLSIVKHIVQRHGGELTVESEPGKGSCFRIVLPPMRVREEVVTAAERTTTALPADRSAG